MVKEKKQSKRQTARTSSLLKVVNRKEVMEGSCLVYTSWCSTGHKDTSNLGSDEQLCWQTPLRP